MDPKEETHGSMSEGYTEHKEYEVKTEDMPYLDFYDKSREFHIENMKKELKNEKLIKIEHGKKTYNNCENLYKYIRDLFDTINIDKLDDNSELIEHIIYSCNFGLKIATDPQLHYWYYQSIGLVYHYILKNPVKAKENYKLSIKSRLSNSNTCFLLVILYASINNKNKMYKYLFKGVESGNVGCINYSFYLKNKSKVIDEYKLSKKLINYRNKKNKNRLTARFVKDGVLSKLFDIENKDFINYFHEKGSLYWFKNEDLIHQF